MRVYMEKRVTPPRRVTSPARGPPPPCKQALNAIVTASDVTSGEAETPKNQRPFGLSRVGQKEIKIYFTK